MFHDVAVTWIWGFFFDEKSTGNFNLTHEGNIVSILAKYWITMVWSLFVCGV
ncbi:hypothetical protein [uncultured Methanobrevibacter sp.]|uniref:hypothetical protein n=1 Tax=uncultured Methanobrevibacter sp. TaxID=253161 RepID=UPI0025F835CF|nr:hypothetical protein [uncultured Methanobrevibacter sp.]